MDEFFSGLGESCQYSVSPLRVNVGESVCLRCNISEANVTWLYNNIPLRETGEVSVGTNGVLDIRSVSQEHAGWYTCGIGNETGRHEVDYLLIASEF